MELVSQNSKTVPCVYKHGTKLGGAPNERNEMPPPSCPPESNLQGAHSYGSLLLERRETAHSLRKELCGGQGVGPEHKRKVSVCGSVY